MSRFGSRKFLAALAAFITGVGMILAGNTDAETISGTVMALSAVIAYIFGEASVDVASVKSTGETTNPQSGATAPTP